MTIKLSAVGPALLAATTALLAAGPASSQSLPGCYPAYSSGASYSAGQAASAASSRDVDCQEGEQGCRSDGTKTVTEVHNYVCTTGDNAAFCGQSGFAPGGQHWDQAWTRSVCDPETTPNPTEAPPVAPVPAAWTGSGCPELYAAGTDYDEGDVVTVPGEVWSTVYQCADGPSHKFCGMSGFAPDVPDASGVWTALGSCDGTIAPTESPSFNAASDTGCPDEWEAEGSDAYEEGDVVSLTEEGASRGVVYKCKAEPFNRFCGMASFRPDSQQGTDAWEMLGFCSGTIAPTTTPSANTASDTGCPDAYEAGTEYDPDDMVSLTAEGASRGVVYKCKEAPLNGFCGMTGYEPDGQHGEDAWEMLGFCSGTITPTTAPAYNTLEDMGGCPPEWEAGGTDKYEEGDMATVGALVFTCLGWPFSAHCGQAGFKPLAEGDHWEEAWTVAGHCAGTITPTASPTFDTTAAACPPDWTATEYEEGDMAAVTVSTEPERKVAYKCKEWPLSQFCEQYSPATDVGGSQGWELVGSCHPDLTLMPTGSPTFDALTEVTGGCPEEYSLDGAAYEAGDSVALVASAAPSRKIVLECKAYPESMYCNQAQFAPGEEHADMAWTVKGYCDGTMPPTPAPSAYAGTCEYTKITESTEACACGDPGCPNPNSLPVGGSCSKTNTVSSTEDVEVYDSSTDYEAGDVVRLGLDRFMCKPWPFVLWCNNDVYKPTSDPDGMWTEAWATDGVCAIQAGGQTDTIQLG